MNQELSLKNAIEPGEEFDIPGLHVLPYNLFAILKLAFSTALFIATLLSVPDAFAIFPSTPEVSTLLVRVVGIWLSVFIQWFLVFAGILLFLAGLAGPVIVDNVGIKLWRFGKPVPWGQIEGITCERAPALFRILPFFHSSSRLNFFVGGEKRITVRNLDSLFFSENEFNCLFDLLALKTFNFTPDSKIVSLYRSESEKSLVPCHKSVALKRGFISAYIFIALVLFLSSQSLKYYMYNASAIDMNKKRLDDARQKLEFATRIDGNFALAWDRLARVSYRSGDLENARKYWLKAIEKNSEIVSARVGLSSIYIRKLEFSKAEAILNSVVESNPRHIPALLNLAQVNFKLGKDKKARLLLDRAVELSGDDSTVSGTASSLYKAAMAEKDFVVEEFQK